MNASLKVIVGPQAGREVAIHGDKFILGREKDCQFQPDSSLVSRHHCVIKTDTFSCRIRDLGSRNGTFVNGEQINGEVVLANGDTILLGDVTLQFASQAPTPEAAAEQTAVLDSSTIADNPDQPAADAPAQSTPHQPAVSPGSETLPAMPQPGQPAPAYPQPPGYPAPGYAGQPGDTTVAYNMYQPPPGYPQPAAYPQQPMAYPQQPMGYPQQPGAYPQQPVGYPQEGIPQVPGFPQQPAAPMQQPQQPAHPTESATSSGAPLPVKLPPPTKSAAAAEAPAPPETPAPAPATPESANEPLTPAEILRRQVEQQRSS